MKIKLLVFFFLFTSSQAFSNISVMYGQDVPFYVPKPRLPILVKLTWDLSNRRTATTVTKDRLQKYYASSQTLTPEQQEATLAILEKHPANDLIAFVKLISSLNRKFVEDDSKEQNLLYSLDFFLQGVKTAFDAEPKLGPDSPATEVITFYSVFLNVAHLELMNPEFHTLSLENKFKHYMTSPLYLKLLTDYALQKTRQILFEYKTQLELENRHTPSEIRRLLRQKERIFREKELPPLFAFYKLSLEQNIRKILFLINSEPLFLNGTVYDFLEDLKNYPGTIALYIEQFLLSLNSENLDKLFTEIVQGLLKNFFAFNTPVDQFMRSLDSEISGATWLSHTVDPLIHGFGDTIPMKDQITLIALIESYQASKELLITEDRGDDLKLVLIPFLKVISAMGQDEKLLNLMNKLHSGKFTDGNTEQKELISRIFMIIHRALGGNL